MGGRSEGQTRFANYHGCLQERQRVLVQENLGRDDSDAVVIEATGESVSRSRLQEDDCNLQLLKRGERGKHPKRERRNVVVAQVQCDKH